MPPPCPPTARDVPEHSLTRRFGFIIEALRRTVAESASRRWYLAPTVLVLWSYLRRVGARFDALVARSRAG